MNREQHKFTETDIRYMKQAFELAAKGTGFVNPNPLVGAVIVKDGEIISEAYHEKFGGHHAEINAINNAKKPVDGATIYLNLEPCSHFGKTPPCSLALIENKIGKVVIAMTDPNPLVSGKGIKMLKDHGIEVTVGILEDEAKKLNEVFIKFITTGLPFAVLKTAMSLDGKIASSTGNSRWISNETSRKFVHHLRNKYSAIMVGVETVINDDPLLTCRILGQSTGNPVRIITDTKLRIPLNSKVINSENARTIIVTGPDADVRKINKLKNKGVEFVSTHLKNNRVDLNELMKKLGKLNIDSVLIEGGGTLNFSAIYEGIVDKIYSFIAPKFIGGKEAKTPIEGKGVEKVADAFEIENISLQNFDNDIMITGYIRK